jgi:ABC-2 type transport system permease protein
MNHTLGLYRRLIAANIRSQMSYRVSFWMESLASFIATITAFITLALILERFNNIAGWTLWEVAFLYGMVETAFGVMDILFSGFDPQNFGLQVRLGRFDQLLLRPASITLQVLGSQFTMRRVGRIAQGLLVLGLAFSRLHLHWTPVKLLYLPVTFASLVAFYGGLNVIGATITFWTVESIEAINIFTYGGSELMAYPMQIYQDWMRLFFTYIVPAIFLNYYPALYFLDKADPFHLPAAAHFLAPVAGFGVLAVGILFWGFGLRHYQSTGT